jgi:multidrug efflux pump subunit AcrA (membrane-fusion protein)
MNGHNNGIARRVLSLLGIVVVLAAGVWVYVNVLAPQTPATTAANFAQVTQVKQGNVSASISAVGQLASVQQSDMAFDRMSGSTKLLTLGVKVGNTVTAAQVLATIDPAPYQQAVDQAQSDLQAAQDNLATLKTPATALQISKSDVAVAQASRDYEQAKYDLSQLVTPDIASLQDAVANAQDALAVAQIQQTLAEHDATAKSERDLLYAVAWHQRRISDLQALVAHGQANLEQTNAVATEQTALGQAQADLAVAQAKRQSALATATATVAAAKATLADAQTALATAQAGGDALALAKARLAVQSSKVTFDSATSDRTTLTAGPDAVTLAGTQADVDRKKLALANAQLDLAGTKLTAPFAGTILQTNVVPGDQIASNTKILTIADLKQLQVFAAVDETTIKKVAPGQTTQITFDALPGQTLSGKVGDVPLQGGLQGGVMIYQVPITLTGADRLPLLVGMTANVKVQLGQAQNALLVPAMAILRTSGGYQVLVPNALDPQGAPTSVPVEIGLSDGVNTQIVKGLNLGDSVVTQLSASSQTGGGNQRGGGGFFGLPIFGR